MNELDRWLQPGRVEIETLDTLPGLRITGSRATLRVTPHGAHVLGWRPQGGAEVLFVSGRSAFAAGRPIRGGVPLVFPWFGPRAADPAAPLHGFARIRSWRVESAGVDAGGEARAEFALEDDAESRAIWPQAFAARLRVAAGARLRIELEVRNTGASPWTFESALHTYFAVADVRQVRVSGLEGVEFVDRLDGGRRKRESEPVAFTAETDRMYLNTEHTCVIDDPAGRRRIAVAKAGSRTTVVWNPWIAKAKAMPDFGDDEWPQMVCVETANAAENAVTLAPGAAHTLAAEISPTPY